MAELPNLPRSPEIQGAEVSPPVYEQDETISEKAADWLIKHQETADDLSKAVSKNTESTPEANNAFVTDNAPETYFERRHEIFNQESSGPSYAPARMTHIGELLNDPRDNTLSNSEKTKTNSVRTYITSLRAKTKQLINLPNSSLYKRAFILSIGLAVILSLILISILS